MGSEFECSVFKTPLYFLNIISILICVPAIQTGVNKSIKKKFKHQVF